MINIVVVGAGVMGANHARVAMSLRDVTVVAVCDPDLERARKLADTVGAAAFASLTDALPLADGVIVAAPNDLHLALGLQCIEAGKPVLIEKPIASSLEEADQLLNAASRSGTLVAVGHIERFNPAVLELDRLATDIVHIDAARVSPYSPRIRDDVVLDLMIHDIDIILSRIGSNPTSIHAVGQSVRSEDAFDIVSAVLVFADGRTASVLASRVGQTKIRQLQITQRENFVTVDLIRQDVTLSRVDHSEFLSSSGTRYRQSGVVEIPFLEHQGEPLFLELSHFVDCIVTGAPPRVPGQVGRQALAVAFDIRASAQQNLPS